MNCLFCQRELIYLTAFRTPQNESRYSYRCEFCHSEQLYTKESELKDYSFKVGKYELRFLPAQDKPFKIYQLTNRVYLDGRKFRDKPLLELDFLPNLTPQTTTEERIKTLILFS